MKDSEIVSYLSVTMKSLPLNHYQILFWGHNLIFIVIYLIYIMTVVTMFDIHFTFFIRILRSYKTDGATFCIFHYVFFLSFIKISSEPELP